VFPVQMAPGISRWPAAINERFEMPDLLQIWLLMFLINSPVYFVWAWILFGGWEGFREAIVFWIKPELWSLLDREYWDDIYAESKLAIWFLLPIGLIRLELWLLGKIIGVPL